MGGSRGDQIVGHFFLNGSLYVELQRKVVDSLITTILGNANNSSEDLFVFQQNGVPPHFAITVRQISRSFGYQKRRDFGEAT